jgi:hypothetical protein
MECVFDEYKDYSDFLDYLECELKDRESPLCTTIKEDLKRIRGNYSSENKRKLTSIVFLLRELEKIQLPIFSEWWKYFRVH